MIYPVGLIIYTSCVLNNLFGAKEQDSNPNLNLASETIFGSLVSLMGIASTLIVVRVTLGIAIHDEKSFKDTIITKEMQHTRSERDTRIIDIGAHTQCAPEFRENGRETLGPDMEAQKMK
ncbi:hypothetical protein PQX77_021080 [Marasmius sp. AFHP31]|nr:hypothetical protein PQX77_021080 [Marasmius sp. AFHP31]